MLAAYPTRTDPSNAPLNYRYSRRGRTDSKSPLKALWKVVEKPEEVSRAASQAGAIFGETKEKLLERIDRRRNAPVG